MNKMKEFEYNVSRDPNNLDYYWSEIRDNNLLLNNAISNPGISKEVYGVNYPRFKSPLIASMILSDKLHVDKTIYITTMAYLFSNPYLARDIDPITNTTFLLKLFIENKTKFTEEQKRFAENEAMTPHIRNKNSYKYVLLHNYQGFDLRDYIMLNKQWSNKERENIIPEFYNYDSIFYNKFFKLLNAIVNNSTNFKEINGQFVNGLTLDNLFTYTYDYLVGYYGNKEQAKEMMRKIDIMKFLNNNPPSVVEAKRLEKI